MSQDRPLSPSKPDHLASSPGTFTFAGSQDDPLAAIEKAEKCIVGQLGQSLDARIATNCGHSKYINGHDGLVHLHRIRAAVDAVLIGVGTAIADDPSLTVRKADGASPHRLILDPNGRLPAETKLLHCDQAPVTIISRKRNPSLPGHIGLIELEERGERIDPSEIVAKLQDAGFLKVLVEGGSATLSSFLEADALDRLHIITAPLLLGSGLSGLKLPEIEKVDEALNPHVTVHNLGSDILFDCAF